MEKTKEEREAKFREEMNQTLKENKMRQKERKQIKRERGTKICKDMILSMLEITEDAHITMKKTGKLTKQNWAEMMKNFVDGLIQNKTSTGQFVFTQSIREADIEQEGAYEVDPKDFTELQNYLCAIANWRPDKLLDYGKKELYEILTQEDVLFPSLTQPNNNSILGQTLKEIHDKAFEGEIQELQAMKDQKRDEAVYPRHMPLRIAIGGHPYSGKKTLASKLVEEYKLQRFDVDVLSAAMEKLINPPPVDEADLKKKPAAGKKDEPQENQEELKELKDLAAQIKDYRERNGLEGNETPERFIAEMLAIKIKYSFEIKTQDKINDEMKAQLKKEKELQN